MDNEGFSLRENQTNLVAMKEEIQRLGSAEMRNKVDLIPKIYQIQYTMDPYLQDRTSTHELL